MKEILKNKGISELKEIELSFIYGGGLRELGAWMKEVFCACTERRKNSKPFIPNYDLLRGPKI